MAKILVVEDDPNTQEMVSTWLSSERHVVECADDGHKALEFMRMVEYDLVLLDWDLPGISGVELLKNFRAAGKQTPVIMLTAKSKVEEKEDVLDGGADDYLTKPYSLKELSARIRVQLRKSSNQSTNELSARGIVIMPEQFRAMKDGAELKLLPKEFSLLEFFMRNPNRVFSAEAIISRVWPAETEVSANAFHSALKRLRQKLEEKSDQKPIVETIHGAGYRFNSD
ncbi:MAG TPA: response regulator transcription factor [Chroococcales cyanobacterium]